ncbi:MAG TPA: ABC transporter permease [Candidatus Methylomirabilis sp.]|nr:ABC transporter permease [Candidatus Methylomirabilis sp.]HSC70750.1 ABC transporter permease [Candidatus Methylomirabilis sp.]
MFRRILQAVPLILGMIVVNFLLIHLAPGDPVTIFLGNLGTSEEYVQTIRERLGLDRPISVQLLIYMGNILRGDLGFSYVSQERVLALILGRVPATLLLVGTALMLASALGVILGVVSARRPYSLADTLNSFVALIGYSVPVFWFGQLLLMFLSLKLGLFPAQGMISLRRMPSGMAYYLDVGHHLALPVLALGLRYLAVNSRYTRASMLEVLGLDYVTTARAKGLPERQVFYRHALRNALLPVVTLFGMNVGVVFAGAVLTEAVFAWPGLGMLMLNAVYARDYPMLMGLLLAISVMVILANLVTDILYALLDPRIQFD